MATKTLANIRDRLESEIQIDSSDAYVDSTEQLDDVNEAYKMTADCYDWLTLLDRTALIPVANVGRYALPSNFRKAKSEIRVLGIPKEETEIENLKHTPQRFAVDRVNTELVLREIPTTAPTTYNLSNAETASSAVTVELDSVDGLSAGDEVFFDCNTATNEEFAFISSVDTDNDTITLRLRKNKEANDDMYLVREIIDLPYYKTITLLANSGDTMLLPDTVDYIVPHYAAHLYFERQQQYDRAKEQKNLWMERLADAWRASDKNSAGINTQFSL